MKTARRLALTFVILYVLGTPATAQAPTGSISGVVADESGAMIPHAKVTVTNVGKGISRILTANSAGRYQAPGLDPGSYEVQAQSEGFQTEIRKGIQLTVGMDAVINLTLPVGQVTQTTIVTAEAPLVETLSGTIARLVDDRTIRDLPLNGRSFDQLISLQSSTPQFRNRASSPATGRGAVFSMGGSRGASNVFLMDGTEVVGASFTSVVPGGALGKSMGVEAIQEFSVLTSNYSAAYGKRGGGVVNIATRSGSNQLHGSAYEFLRNDNLDARNFFDATSDPPEFKRNQFGGAVGGPIRQDRMFFFGNYEGLRESLGLTRIAIVPDNNARLGLLPGVSVPVSVASAIKPYFVLYPAPNGRVFGDGTAEYLSSPAQISRQDFFLVRYDQKISDKDSFFIRYSFTDGRLQEPKDNPSFTRIGPGRDQLLTLQETRAYATRMNVLRFGYTRSVLVNDELPSIPIDASLSFLPGAPAVGQITIGSGSSNATNLITNVGTAGSAPRFAFVNQFDIGDQVYSYRGSHSFQFGGKYQRIQHNDDNGSSKRGQFTFASLADFLAAKPSQFQGPDPTGGGDATKGWRQNYWAIFLQDDVKVRRTLAVNLGVRWEVMTAPTEASGNRISNYRPELTNGVAVLRTQPFLGAPLFYTNFGTVAPRFGFAWDTFGNGLMAVRGGVGVFYDQIEKSATSTIASNPPYFQLVQIRNPNFPLGFSGAAGTGRVPQPAGLDLHEDTAPAWTYNLGIDRQVTQNTLFTIGYVGSHAYHLIRSVEPNAAIPQVRPGGIYFYPPGAARKNPLLGSGTYKPSDANASYNSLQLDFVQRLSHGLRYKISYTFSKTIDTASQASGPEAQNTAGGAQNPDDLRAERGLSAYDVRNNFVANFTYDLPGRNLAGILRHLAGGWQVGSIFNLSSGFPVDIQTGFNRSGDLNTANTSDRPDLKPGASNSPVRGGPDQYYDPVAFALPAEGFYGNLGRNTLIGPGFANLDLTLVKSVAVGERYKADFRAEFFNIINHANFGLPNPTVFQPNGQYVGAAGRISSTTSSSRQIQFGLKLSF